MPLFASFQVLRFTESNCSIEEQRALLYQSLRVMPLKLLERVLPWMVAILSEDETKEMLQNLRLAGTTLFFDYRFYEAYGVGLGYEH